MTNNPTLDEHRESPNDANPFNWMLRAACHDINGIDVCSILTSIGKLWRTEERKFECDAKPPFTYIDIEGETDMPLIPPCADHTRYIMLDGGCACVIEPYQKTMQNIEELIGFCKDRGLTFTIDGESSHFPGGCIRIVIKKSTGCGK